MIEKVVQSEHYQTYYYKLLERKYGKEVAAVSLIGHELNEAKREQLFMNLIHVLPVREYLIF